MKRIVQAAVATALFAITSTGNAYAAPMITIVGASTFTGPEMTSAGPCFPTQCSYRPFDTTGDLAYQGGLAANAIASSTIPGYPHIHLEGNANDGLYGNGRSWIGNSAQSWLKIDLGQTVLIDRLTFGRDRLGYFDDRDPGQFTIEVATMDAVFASGDATDDGDEYTNVLDSSMLGFSGTIVGAQTIQGSFDPVAARYVKMTFANNGVAIDEVEVFAVPEPGTLALFGLGLAGLGFARRRKTA
jgi:hypothetical protein